MSMFSNLSGAARGSLRCGTSSVALTEGQAALTRSTWSMTGTDPEGKPVTMCARSAEVVRRQSDGTWKFVIDNPHGSDNS